MNIEGMSSQSREIAEKMIDMENRGIASIKSMWQEMIHFELHTKYFPEFRQEDVSNAIYNIVENCLSSEIREKLNMIDVALWRLNMADESEEVTEQIKKLQFEENEVWGQINWTNPQFKEW